MALHSKLLILRPTAAASGVNASLAWTEDSDTWAVNGSLSVTGTVGWTEADDVFSVAGTVKVSGSVAWTESDDTWAIAGSVTSGSVDAAIAWTEANDTWAVVVAVQDSSPQASNWQANYWKHRSKQQRKEDEDAQRRALGILPELEELAAVAVEASVQVQKGDHSALLAAMEAREEAERLLRETLLDEYRAEFMTQLWDNEIKRIRRNRAISLLLLH